MTTKTFCSKCGAEILSADEYCSKCNTRQSEDKNKKKIALVNIFNFVLGVTLFVIGFATFVTGDYIPGILLFLIVFLLVPSVVKLLETKLSVSISGVVKIILGTSLFLLACALVSPTHIVSPAMADSITTQAPIYHNGSQDAEWANNVTETTQILMIDANDISKAANNSDWYTTFASIDTYNLDLSNAITSSDSFTVSPELQPCKDEYKLGLIDDYNAAVLLRTSINLLTSGDFAKSTETADLVTEKFRSANRHYDNVTYLLESYNKDHQSAPLNLSTQYHSVTQEDDQSTVNTPPATTEPKIKTLADKEPDEPEGMHVSEETIDSTDTSKNMELVDSSTHNIFDYCTWEARTASTIGEYSKAPDNKVYVIVTLKINNIGDQTYTTNPFSWHLKVGDRYYQHSTETYDKSINFLSTDVGPGGKLTTEIVFLVDGNPSISDVDLYYDGPGSDGTIHS